MAGGVGPSLPLSTNLEQGILDVESNGGRSHLNHPGRYFTPSEWSWFIPWYRDYSTCIGLEVFNKKDAYPTDRQLWDNINENMFPAYGKLVWGFSNDDMHVASYLYHNYQFMMMPSLTHNDLVTCMDNGAFYFCYEPTGTGSADVPRITNITTDNTAKTITITATGYNRIDWIGSGTVVVDSGQVFNYSEYINAQFIRAVLVGANGESHTQPFGFSTTSEPVIPSTKISFVLII